MNNHKQIKKLTQRVEAIHAEFPKEKMVISVMRKSIDPVIGISAVKYIKRVEAKVIEMKPILGAPGFKSF